MKLSQRLATGVAAFGLIGGVTAFAAAPAEAATTTPNTASCVFVSGTTNEVGVNTHGVPELFGGSRFTKPGTSTCHDFNLWSGQVGVSYEGWLLTSNGIWEGCAAGYVRYSGGSIPLCTNVLPGTIEAVTSSNGSGHGIEIMD